MVSPFSTRPVQSVPLVRTPLVVVLAQVRFPKTAPLGTEATITSLQQALRRDYPILRQQQSLGIVLTPQGLVQTGPEQVWQLQDKTSDWTISLTDTFVTLSTKRYESRKDLCERLSTVLAEVQQVADPVIYDRIGVRYVNRIEDDDFAQLGSLVRLELLGGRAVPLDGATQLVRSMGEAQFANGADVLQVRHAVLPPGESHDPAIAAAARWSWVLDLDGYTDVPGDFSAGEITSRAERFAERAYTFFRWALTDRALSHFGGAR